MGYRKDKRLMRRTYTNKTIIFMVYGCVYATLIFNRNYKKKKKQKKLCDIFKE